MTALRPYAAPALPAIAEQFYASILSSESARIGQTHVRVAAPPRYVVGSMSCIRAGLLRVAAGAMPHDVAEVACSISKVLDIECALMMDAYAEHWLARVQREERAELNRVRTRLEDVEWAFEQSAETANMLVIGLDASGQVVLFNAAASVTGVSPADALGRDAFELLFGEAASTVREVVLASRPVPPFLELTLRAREGDMRTCRFYLARHVPWGSDRPTHLLTAIDWRTSGERSAPSVTARGSARSATSARASHTRSATP